MTGSSELSDALNPYYFQDAQHIQTNISPNYDQHTSIPTSSPSIVPQQNPVLQSHRSELADAINPAAVSPSTAARVTALKPTRQLSGDALQLLKGLIQSIASYKAAVEQEKKRRLAWERDQEMRYIARQAELEKRVADLQRELNSLKAKEDLLGSASGKSPNNSTAYEPSRVPGEAVILFDPPASETELPEFVEGSSSSPQPTSQNQPRSDSPHGPSKHEPSKSSNFRVARVHTIQVKTIQAAMRNHVLACMELDDDKELPPSHNESFSLGPTQPVRFVWERTTKKSSHNAKMKFRVVNDIIANRGLYPLVPAKDFTAPKLEGVFEQAFMTLRQKYASQRGAKPIFQDRAENKARKARRLSRKKIKLANRVTTRASLEQYSVPEFDLAFQLDCMSSEESSEEETEVVSSSAGDKPSLGSLRIRILAWRSARLQELYRVVDEHEQYNRESKPKRGAGRRDRHLGPPKDGNPPPPMGTPRWMVSKKWLRQACGVNPQIATLVTPVDENTTTNVLSVLGEESEDEREQQEQEQGQEIPPPSNSQPDFAQLQMPVSDYSMIDPMMPMDHDAYQHAQYMYAQQAAWADTMGGFVDLSQFSSPLLQPYPPSTQHPS